MLNFFLSIFLQLAGATALVLVMFHYLDSASNFFKFIAAYLIVIGACRFAIYWIGIVTEKFINCLIFAVMSLNVRLLVVVKLKRMR